MNDKIIRLHKVLDRWDIDNLMEYTIESDIDISIDGIYKELIKELLPNRTIYTYSEEISDGKYKIYFNINNKEYNINVCSFYTSKEIIEQVIDIVNNIKS